MVVVPTSARKVNLYCVSRFLVFLTDAALLERTVIGAGWEGFSKLMNLSKESFENQAFPVI